MVNDDDKPAPPLGQQLSNKEWLEAFGPGAVRRQSQKERIREYAARGWKEGWLPKGYVPAGIPGSPSDPNWRPGPWNPKNPNRPSKGGKFV